MASLVSASFSTFIRPSSALSLLLDANREHSVRAEGYKMLIHEPGLLPPQKTLESYLLHGRESFVQLQPATSTCSEAVSQLAVNDRGCFFEAESSLM